MTTATGTRTITVAHSPDSDDAFMFYGLATNKIETGDLRFEHTLEDIQTLNEKATRGVYDVTAISFHAYAYISDRYALLPHGASIGDNYGPIVVAREPRRGRSRAPSSPCASSAPTSSTSSCPSTGSSAPSRTARRMRGS